MDYYARSKKIILMNSRPLDMARWNYLFENGSKEDVINILKTYQNKDGSWKVTWDWNNEFEEGTISKNWWKSDIIIKNIKYIKEFGLWIGDIQKLQ